MKQLNLILICVALIIMLVGCGDNNQATGSVIASLKDDSITNGATTTITVNGKNTGTIPAQVILRITPEDPNRVKVTYPGSLESTLQPNEDMGNKIVNVQAFTDYSSTKYWVKVDIINKLDNSTLDEKTQWITVNK